MFRRRRKIPPPPDVRLEHHDDGWSARLVFERFPEGEHRGRVRLDPALRDFSMPVEFNGTGTEIPLDWRPTVAIYALDGARERLVTV